MTDQFPAIRNVDACIGTVELMVDDLPTVNFLLASHRLYTDCWIRIGKKPPVSSRN